MPEIPLEEFLLATFAMALATPALVAALSEPAPPLAVGKAPLVFGAAWALAFAAGAVLLWSAGSVGAAGLMTAAAELCAAAVVWLGRAQTRGDADEGGGPGVDGGGGDAPRGGPSVPDEYWARWEEQLASGQTTFSVTGALVPALPAAS